MSPKGKELPLLLAPKPGGAVLRSALKPDPVGTMGETGGTQVHLRRSGSNGSEERSGTAPVATTTGVPTSVPEVVAVEGGRHHGNPVAGCGGGKECMWASFPRSGSRVILMIVVALIGAVVWLYIWWWCKRAGGLNRTKVGSTGLTGRAGCP